MAFSTHSLTVTVGTKFRPQTVLHNVSITVPAGIIGVLGPNGAGKSTLFRALAGLIPSAGEINYTDSPTIDSPEDDNLSHPTFSSRPIMGFSTKEAQFAGSRIKDHIHSASLVLPDFDSRLALNTLAENNLHPRKRISSLSEGEQQQLVNITALSSRTHNLFLDEPFNGLDTSHREHLRESILAYSERNPDSTILLSSHHASDLAGLIDGIVRIDSGSVDPLLSLDDLRLRYPTLAGRKEHIEEFITSDMESDVEIVESHSLGSHHSTTIHAVLGNTHMSHAKQLGIHITYPTEEELIRLVSLSRDLNA